MPEVVLPMIAFVMSVIGWYGMLRNGVQLVYDDLQASSTHERDVKAILEDLSQQERALDEWRRQWLIFKGTSNSFLTELWGEVELRTIETRIENMKANHKVARKKLSHYTIKDKQRIWQSMSKPKKFWLTSQFIWTKKNYVQKMTDRMAKDMAGINEAAKKGWLRRYRYLRNDVDFRQVYHTGMGHLLVPIAMSAREDANALHLGCRAAQSGITIRLDLDVFDHSGDVSDGAISNEAHKARIADAADKGHLIWSFVVADPTRGDGYTSRMAVERSDPPPDGPLSAPIAFSQAMDQSIKRYFQSSRICFSIGKAAKLYEWTSDPPRTLLESLSRDADSPGVFSSSQSATLSKYRIAFELAQACLLFLTTPWIPSICSCSIYCKSLPLTSAPFQHEFALDIDRAEQNVQDDRRLHLGERWCTSEHNWNFLTNPIRRLGLLLVEVFIGQPVHTATTTTEGVIDTLQMLLSPSETVDRVLERPNAGLRDEDRVRDAVRYCLTEILPDDSPNDADMKKILARFYFHVVAPLKDYYDSQLTRVLSCQDLIRIAMAT